ncbi:hypothetical protein AKJ37_00135 [candidate division MSBL1 archaeon SCGC-AAA259I09]|uniref:Type II toxin-antitoxin system HicA family toxin n=3 Tax=candidate division MSBL1 TaxID=215777 RepID=A0A133UW76_9EURY|nr:hypothetical protein AKJ61_00450 [candidate division MSBL1 archaeon SCGC-AAA259B11]KXA98406.1 hypothetical protein AKJ37_00135 [candidate division MSBL1 archaeon SCGC-AAA259I09]KXB00372.1 hypothetical protein AKJ40_01410 [candidate division MSBL1 archaeon SCGC-AAA259M10]
MIFSGEEVIRALQKRKFVPVRQSGSHVILKYRSPVNPEDVRVVTVPLHDELNTSTLRSIAEQAGAKDFQKFKKWIDRNR